MNNTNTPHKRGFPFLYPNIYTHRTRNLLFISFKPNKSMNHRSYLNINNDSYSFPGLRTPLGTNILLRSYCNHRSFNSNPISRKWASHMNLRRTFCIKPNPKPILLSTLHFTHSNYTYYTNPPNHTTRKRIFKPIKHNNKYRQNQIQPNIFSQRYLTHTDYHNGNNTNTIKLSKLTRRCRKFFSCKPISSTPTYPTRMIFFICLCNLTINPIKIRRSNRPNNVHSYFDSNNKN